MHGPSTQKVEGAWCMDLVHNRSTLPQCLPISICTTWIQVVKIEVVQIYIGNADRGSGDRDGADTGSTEAGR